MKQSQNGKIKAVIFDLGNVLIYFDAVKAAKRFAEEANVPLERVWAHFFISRIEKMYTRGRITTREFYEHSRRAFQSDIDFKKFSWLWNDIFRENRGIQPVLKRLSRRYPLYLISNTNELHFNHVRKKFPQVFKHFRRAFPSHRLGHRKPDPRVYWKVLRTIGLKPEQTIFVDDMPKFIKAAKKVGMEGIQFRSNRQLATDLRRLGLEL